MAVHLGFFSDIIKYISEEVFIKYDLVQVWCMQVWCMIWCNYDLTFHSWELSYYPEHIKDTRT
jgi:hypothetical protein